MPTEVVRETSAGILDTVGVWISGRKDIEKVLDVIHRASSKLELLG